MGKLIVEEIISADGYAARPDGGIDFFQSAGDFAETDQEQLQVLSTVDAILLGANTYKMFADYWPTADPVVERIAGPINTLPKHVVAARLHEAPWGGFTPATLERAPLAAVVHALKERYQGSIMVWGSLKLCESLFRLGEVDEVRLRIIPVLIGAGIPLTPPELETTKLTLLDSRTYPHGFVSLSYTVRH